MNGTHIKNNLKRLAARSDIPDRGENSPFAECE